MARVNVGILGNLGLHIPFLRTSLSTFPILGSVILCRILPGTNDERLKIFSSRRLLAASPAISRRRAAFQIRGVGRFEETHHHASPGCGVGGPNDAQRAP